MEDEDTYESFPTFVFDGVLLGLLLVGYSATIFMLLIRKHHQPLKNKGANLIIISAIGNFLFCIILMVNKMIANAFKVGSFFEAPTDDGDLLPTPNQAAVEFSCALSHIQYGIFMPVFFFPYYMRAYRLFVVYKSHLEHFEMKKKRGVLAFKKAKSLHCARESNMITWLVVILAPLTILSLLGVLIQGFRPYYPSFEVKSCFLQKGQYIQNSELEQAFRLHLYLTVEVYLVFNFFLDGLLMAFIYLLRKVQQEFSMTFELMTITITQLAIGFLIFFIIIIDPETSLNKTNDVQYIIVARGVLFLVVSAILPLRATYNPNSIIPFPINEECIKTLEMALLMPTSANYFYEYLETLCGTEKNRDALVYFGLYADIRSYLRLIEEGEEEPIIRAHA